MSKVLIIDDDQELCETFSDILQGAGHEIHVLTSGKEAFRVLPKLAPNIVLLDMNMPGVPGMLTLGFIRRLSRLAHTRVIIVSGHPDLAEEDKAMWGADMFLAKPVTPRQLLEAIAIYT